MTSPNRFQFDVVADDKASDKVDKVTASVQRLIPVLQTANTQFEAIARSIGSIGTVNFGGLAQAQVRAAQGQERARDRSAAATRRQAAEEERFAAQALSAERAEERAYQRKINVSHAYTAQRAREAALEKSTSAERLAALQAEITRSKAVRAEEERRHREAQEYAAQTGHSARFGSFSNEREQLAAVRESVYAAGQLADAEQRVKATHADVTAAKRLLNAETRSQAVETAKAARAAEQEAKAVAQAAAQADADFAKMENNLTRTRYALYQTALAWGSVAAAITLVAAKSVSTAMSFETSGATLGRTTGLGITAREGGAGAAEAARDLKLMNDELIEMSRNIPVAFEDLAAIGSLGAQLGISEDQVASFTDTVAKFSATTDVASDQAAKSFGQLQNIIDVPAAQFNNLGSAIAQLGVDSVATETEILAVATQIGAVGNNAGLSAPYVLGLSTALASVRVAPELARGALLGVFQNISRAAAEGGDKLAAWARVMGMTSTAAKNMIDNDTQQFFSQFITRMGQAAERGENLIPVLDSIGIKGRRDVPVIQRLANSYQLLGDYVGKSQAAFESGTFLDEAFAAQTDTAAAAIERLINSARALANAIGAPFLEPIKVVSNVLNGFLEILEGLPAYILGPLGGLVAGIGVFAALKSAVALAGATLFAYKVAQSGLNTAVAEGVIPMTGFTGAVARFAIGSRAAQASATGLAGSIGTIGAAAAGATVGVTGVTAATAGAGAAAGVAATGFKGLSTAFKLLGGLGLVVGLIAAVWTMIEGSGEAADEAARKQKALNAEFLAKGSGASGLKKALDEDTKAWEAAGRAANDANGVYKTVERSIGNATGAVETQTVALGKNVDAWRKNNLMQTLKESFSGGTELQAAIDRIGVGRLDNILTQGLKRGAEGLKSYIFSAKQDLKSLNQAIADESYFSEAGQTFVGNPRMLARRAEVEQFIADLEKIAQAAETSKLTIDEQVDSDSAFVTLQNLLAGDTEALVDLQSELDGGIDKIQLAMDTWNSFVGEVTKPLSLETGLLDSFQKLGESIGENGPDFSQFSENGRKNLDALMQTIDAYDAVQQDAIARGQIGVEQAAVNMQAFVADLMNQLSAMGIDTSPLDALEARLAAITGVPSTAIVNVDVSAGMANLAALQQQIRITTMMNAVATARASGGNMFKAIGAGVGAVTNIPATTPGIRGSVTPAVAAQTLLAGRAKAANDAAEKAGKSAGKANDTAADAAKRHADYLKDIAGYYDKLGSSILGAVKAEGDTFAALDELGASLLENGRNFNTVTEGGRKNFDALASTLDAFGATLGDSVERGTLSVDQAGARYREFARGLYSELVAVGVPVQQLAGMFRALGVDASGWAGASADVAQYAGRITEAASATADFLAQTSEAEEWADKLGNAFERITERQFGLSDAIDSVQSAMNGLRESYQESIDKAEELRRANEKLSADLGTAQADKRKAEIEQAISLRYGEVDRAADYGAKAAEAQARINETQAEIDANNKERAALEEGRNALDGYSDAAIQNRKVLSDLQKQMLDQIVAYAKTGATTEEVARYTDQLSREFGEAARSAGYTETQIQRYTGTFRTYAEAIRAVPRTVDITTTNLTRSVLDEPNYEYVKWKLGQIPKAADYRVTASVDGGSIANVNAQLAGIGSGITSSFGNAFATIGRAVGDAVKAGIGASLLPIANSMADLFSGQIPGRWMGGPVAGYASGGPVIGPAPSHPMRDNLLARGPDGRPIGLQGDEFIIRRSAVQHWGIPFLSAINSGTLSAGYARGSGSSGGRATVEAVLSPEDRALLSKLGGQQSNLALYADSTVIARTNSKGNVRLATRGASR